MKTDQCVYITITVVCVEVQYEDRPMCLYYNNSCGCRGTVSRQTKVFIL